MRKTAIIGVLSLLVMLAMAAPSAAVVTFSLVPQHGSADCGGETVVGLWANSPDPINNFQLALTYDESCVNIVDVDWSVASWMLTDWNETAIPCHDENGIEWLKAWSLFNVGSGDVHLCDITFRCNDAACCYCVSNLNFTCGLNCEDCAIVSGNEDGALPVAWVDGTFTCGEEAPDLIVEEIVQINPDCKHYYFANEPNVVDIKIKNIGTAAAGESHARVTGASGASATAAVGALNPGQSETVRVSDAVARPAGEVVTAIADCDGEVTECNETNNGLEIVDGDGDNVINAGLKGKWLAEGYAGPDPGNMTTWKSYELHGNLDYSVGDSYYLSGSNAWEHYTANWTAADLPIPDGATVVEARLYVYYCWDKAWVFPDNVSTEFNDAIQEPEDVHYTDRRGYGSMASFNLPYGAIIYNVTDDFDTGGNHANVTKLCDDLAEEVSPRGMMLVVVYEDPTEPLRQIFVIEEFDNLFASTAYCTSSEEATAWALFTGPAIDMEAMVNAKLITFVNGAGAHDGVYNPTEGDLIFNGHLLSDDAWDFLPGPTTGGGTYGETELGACEHDVTTLLQATDNRAGMRSNDTKSEWMEPSNAILVMTMTTDSYVLNWDTYPYSTWNASNWSGPAAMEMMISHYTTAPSQSELDIEGRGNNHECQAPDFPYVDRYGMRATLNAHLYPAFAHYGNHITTDVENALHYICWWQSLGPGAVPAYQDYSNWMVVRGIHTNINPRDGSYYPPYGYTIHGFWINDPNPSGIGENSYKCVNQFTDNYYQTMQGQCDVTDGNWVSICEPPEVDAEITLAVSPVRFADAITPVMIEKPLIVYGVEQLVLEKVVKDDETLKIVAAAIDGVNEQLTPYDAEFAATFAKTTAGEPMLATDDDGDDYYLVPFNAPLKKKPIKKVPIEIEKVKISGHKDLDRLKLVNEKTIIKPIPIEPIPIEPIKVERTFVVVLVDAEDGSFKEASWVADPVKYLPVSKVEALKLALGKIRITAKEDLSSLTSKPTIELVHRDASPYHPDWKITVNDQVFYVSQDGTVSS